MNNAPDPKVCLACHRPHGSWTCERCHQPHPNCTGHNRAGGPCGRRKAPGQCTCTSHGAGSPQAKAAALARIQHAEALQAVHTLGVRSNVSPSEALLEEVQWTAGHVHWLRAKVREMHPDTVIPNALVFGVTLMRDKRGGEDHGKTTEAKAAPSVWYQLYLEERKHLVAVCAAALKAGVEERRVRVAEQQGELLAQAIRGILADLGLTEQQQALVGEVVPRHLRMIAGGAA